MIYKNNIGFIRFFLLIVLCALTAMPATADSLGLSYKVLEAAKDAKQIIVFTRFLTRAAPKGMEVTIRTWRTAEDWLKKPESEKKSDFIYYDMMNVYERKNLSDEWKRIIFSPNCIGDKNLSGLGGVFRLIKASGIKENPGNIPGYLKLDDTYYWCEDPQSQYFNQFISTHKYKNFNIGKGKHVSDFPEEFAYSLIIRSTTNTKSASDTTLLLQCQGKNASYEDMTGIAIPQADMYSLLRHLKKDCIIIITEEYR